VGDDGGEGPCQGLAAYAVAKRARKTVTRKRAYGVVRVALEREARLRGFMTAGLCGLRAVD
jgi:hypothetical protein